MIEADRCIRTFEAKRVDGAEELLRCERERDHEGRHWLTQVRPSETQLSGLPGDKEEKQ